MKKDIVVKLRRKSAVHLQTSLVGNAKRLYSSAEFLSGGFRLLTKKHG